MITMPKIGAMFVAKSSVALNLFLLAALVLGTVSKNATISSLRDQIDNPKTGYKVQLATTYGYWEACKRNREGLVASLNTQNRAVASMAAASEQMAQAGKVALQEVREHNKPLDIKVRQVMEARPTGDLCKSADALILETVK